jgi:hypothetical protein
VKELTEDGTATFHFIHGPCTAVPPEGFEEYFGKPPYFRFIEPDQDVETTHDDDVLSRIRDFPDCETPEDTMRELMREGIASSHKSTDQALKFLVKIMEERGPFEGIIGYSEGATVAATLLLLEQRRAVTRGTEPMFKYAIFFAGWPPVDPVTHFMVLADESDEVIEIPTCHISKSSKPGHTFSTPCSLILQQSARWILMSTARWPCSTSAILTMLIYLITLKAIPSLEIRTRSRNWEMWFGRPLKPTISDLFLFCLQKQARRPRIVERHLWARGRSKLQNLPTMTGCDLNCNLSCLGTELWTAYSQQWNGILYISVFLEQGD